MFYMSPNRQNLNGQNPNDRERILLDVFQAEGGDIVNFNRSIRAKTAYYMAQPRFFALANSRYWTAIRCLCEWGEAWQRPALAVSVTAVGSVKTSFSNLMTLAISESPTEFFEALKFKSRTDWLLNRTRSNCCTIH